jgi:HlyD family secretion protein
MAELFRSEAVKRIRSPEQIDRMMQVTGSPGWIALATLGAIIVAAILWGLFGSLPTHVSAKGILLSGADGTQKVVASGSGLLSQLSVKGGDEVKRGQVIAKLELEEIKQKIADLERELTTIQGQRGQQEAFWKTYSADQRKNFAQQRAALQANLASTEKTLVSVRQILESFEKLFKDGYASQIQVVQAREKVFQTQASRDQTRNEINQIAVNELDLDNKRNQAMQSYDDRILQTTFQLNETRGQLADTGVVRAPVDGRVVLVEAEANTVVSAGTAIVTLEYGDNALHGVLYAPATSGKEIKPGMRANVSPSTVKREQYGTIVGDVEYVSDFPATTQAINRLLNNDQLVASITAEGPVILVRVTLKRDPATQSGFAWSSRQGPPVTLSSGTIATTEITTVERRPITYVIPALRRWFGVDA